MRDRRCSAPTLSSLAALALLLFASGCAGAHAAPDAAEAYEAPPALDAPVAPQARTGSGAGLVASSVHVALGVPTDDDASDDYLMDKGVYVVSYNPDRRVPNWVSWKVDASDLGSAGRSSSFRADPSLPSSFTPPSNNDYKRSGYDRGHMCPSADRTRTAAENALTFLLTNVQPQVHELNGGPWAALEDYERELARDGHRVYVVAGGIFAESGQTIGAGVAVPVANYKVVVALEPGAGPGDVRDDADVTAVVLANDRTVAGERWQDHVVSVDDVEAASGYELLSAVPSAVQRVLERQSAFARAR